MQQYLQLWFPKEVKAKSIANKKEAAQEDMEEMVSRGWLGLLSDLAVAHALARSPAQGFTEHRCMVQ